MNTADFLSTWIRRFILEYFTDRNLSKNTQLSYRDTLRLLLPFAATYSKKPIDKLEVNNITPDLIKEFLLHLELQRKCSIRTRNQRLAAINAFSCFVGLHSPEHVEWYRQLHLIPSKKTKKQFITYLEKSEMDELLNAPDCLTQQGRRDHALILFLYNTGARADEAAQLTIGDLNIAHAIKRDFSIAVIKGKGNKLRQCPLWQKTTKELIELINGRSISTEHVFLNRFGQPLTRFGIYALIKRYLKQITQKNPSLSKKRVSPHTIRHTTATHLLKAGVDINTIRIWLGHVSINTTNIYAEVDLDMKAKALECCELTESKKSKHWRDNEGLMQFLNTI